MDGLVSRASMIRLSLHPLPASETSAFNKIRAFSTRRAGLFPFRISVSSRSRSSPLSLTTINGDDAVCSRIQAFHRTLTFIENSDVHRRGTKSGIAHSALYQAPHLP